MILSYDSSGLLLVQRDSSDPKIRKPGWEGTDPDSTFFYQLKKVLNKKGFTLIKSRISKDGHLFGNDNTTYLRVSHSKSNGPHVIIYDANYAIRLAVDDYNAGKVVKLSVLFDIFSKQVDCKQKVDKIFNQDRILIPA